MLSVWNLSNSNILMHVEQSARELSAVMWGQELTGALEQLNSVLVSNGDVSPPNMFYFGTKIKAAIRDIWRNAPTDVFDNAYEYS